MREKDIKIAPRSAWTSSAGTGPAPTPTVPATGARGDPGGRSLAHLAQRRRGGRQDRRRATNLDELLTKAVNRTGLLDGFTEQLTARFRAGTTDAVTLNTQLLAIAFTGSVQTVRRYLHPLRQGHSGTRPARPQAARPRPTVSKPRRIVRWIMTDPNRLDPDDQAQLAQVPGQLPGARCDSWARHGVR
jgi:hypothetical protein